MHDVSRLLAVALLLGALRCGSEGNTPPPVASSKRPVLEHLMAHLDEGGVSMLVDGEPIGPGCAGGSGITLPVRPDAQQDVAGVSACARKLKSDPRLDGETSVTIAASPGMRYADVIALADALRVDTAGELFPEVHFGAPRRTPTASTKLPSPPLAISLIAMSDRTARVERGTEPTIVRISKTAIDVGEDAAPVLAYRSLDELRENGLDVKHKRNGQDDPFIVPLGHTLKRYRDDDKKLRAAIGLDAASSELLLVADESVPYRVLYEVLYTAGQSEFGRYQLLVRAKSSR
jgi:hypothetical protein